MVGSGMLTANKSFKNFKVWDIGFVIQMYLLKVNIFSNIMKVVIQVIEHSLCISLSIFTWLLFLSIILKDLYLSKI